MLKQHLMAIWGGGDVVAELWVPQKDWKDIVAGVAMTIHGSGYYYEGEPFCDEWYFNSDGDGLLRITYTNESGDTGDGYVGSIEDVIISKKPG